MKKPVWRLLNPNTIWYFVFMQLVAASAAVLRQYYLAGGALLATVIVFIISRAQLSRRKRELMSYVQKATDSAGISVHAGSAFPMAVIRLPDNEIIWGNPSFFAITGLSDTASYQKLEAVIPDFSNKWLSEGHSEMSGDRNIGDRRYRIYGNFVRSEDSTTTVQLATIYFADMTEMFNIRDEFMRTRPVVSIVLIDNYDELTTNLSDSAISTLDAQLNDVVANWTTGLEALCRKIERNRYLVIFESKDLPRLQESRFSTLLEDVRHITSTGGMSATISLGIGKDGGSFAENYQFASLAIEMSLSRGGDQAVIKDRFNFTFYGSRVKETDRRTRIRSRLIASSLSELISQSSTVYIMGHRMADLDALGAAVGLLCLCRIKGCRAKIVIDLQKNACQSLIAELRAIPDYADLFISGQDALVEADNRSLLIVVDTNRPGQVESRPLLEAISRVVLIDHHRNAADSISQTVVKLHEPSASSASELVTELLQYAVNQRDLKPIEAQALLSGIVLDTKNFSIRTSPRTFESAAYLRKAGADPVEVKKLFQTDLDDTLLRYRVIQAARLYRNEIAIACVDEKLTRVIASQAADELINVSGITTSFVLFPDDGQIIISARSIGSCNVQAVLETLGNGGGNGATAGAQIKGKPLQEVLKELIAAIDAFYS
ncbi:MAG: DHH family phosphoesterase [Oscillospiraceae bacterium]